MIYLDHAATSYPKREEVCIELDRLNRTLAVNVGRGTYRAGRKGSRLIEEARWEVARFAGWDEPADVYFFPSATVAMNQVLGGLVWHKGDVVYISVYEHNAVVRTLEAIRQSIGICIELLPVDERGYIDLPAVEYQFERKPPRVVCINMVSNVTGYILPVEEVAGLARRYQSIVIVDGAQGFGVIPMLLRESAVDILVFSGHKSLGGPFGVGGFINRTNLRLQPVIFGGNGMDSKNPELPESGPGRYEVGSQNIVAIGGLKRAVELCGNPMDLLRREQEMIQFLYQGLKQMRKIKIFQPPTCRERFAGVISVAVEGCQSEEIGQILDADFNIAVRTGYHCAPLVHDIIGSNAYGGTVRISVGEYTERGELEKLMEALEALTIV